MVFQAAATSGTHVAGDTRFHRDLALSEDLHQFAIFHGMQSVPDALGANVERGPDRGGPHSLAGMCGQAQPVLASVSINVFVHLRAGATLVATNADGDHVSRL